jgi:hypothetical protein
VLIGVDSIENLRANLEWARRTPELANAVGPLAEMQEDDERILLPTLWPK